MHNEAKHLGFATNKWSDVRNEHQLPGCNSSDGSGRWTDGDNIMFLCTWKIVKNGPDYTQVARWIPYGTLGQKVQHPHVVIRLSKFALDFEVALTAWPKSIQRALRNVKNAHNIGNVAPDTPGATCAWYLTPTTCCSGYFHVLIVSLASVDNAPIISWFCHFEVIRLNMKRLDSPFCQFGGWLVCSIIMNEVNVTVVASYSQWHRQLSSILTITVPSFPTVHHRYIILGAYDVLVSTITYVEYCAEIGSAWRVCTAINHERVSLAIAAASASSTHFFALTKYVNESIPTLSPRTFQNSLLPRCA